MHLPVGRGIGIEPAAVRFPARNPVVRFIKTDVSVIDEVIYARGTLMELNF
jgi:hypothetical protein